MKKITIVALIIIAVGVCLALAGFAAGGWKGYWTIAPAAPAAPSAPNVAEPPEPPEPRGFLRGIMGGWFDRGGIRFSGSDRGALVKVDENYDGFTDIVLDADFFTSITYKEGDGYAVRGQNYERYGGLNVRVDSGTLHIDAKRDRKWLNFGIDEWFKWNEKECWLEITYPKGAKFGAVNANVSAGHVIAGGFDCEELYIDNSFGKIEVSAVSCGTMLINSASGDTRISGVDVRGKASVDNDFGNVNMKDVGANDLIVDLNAGNASISGVTAATFRVSNDFGKITLENIEADTLTLRNNSGDLSAERVKTKDLFVDSDFGLVRIDRLEFSGVSEIEQNSGDVRVSLDMSEDDLSYELSASAGSVNVDGERYGNSTRSRNAGAEASLRISADFGAITLKFLK